MANRHMKAGLLLIIICAGIGFASKASSVPVFPDGGRKITVTISGKNLDYWQTGAGTPMTLRVTGPGTITIISRLAIPPHDTATKSYMVDVLENGKSVKQYSTQTAASKAVFKGLNAVPGKSRKCTVTVPEGKHVYEIRSSGSAPANIALRFSFSGGQKQEKAVPLEPTSYDQLVTLVVKEKLITYYVSSKTKAVSLKVVGPTILQITSRLNFDKSMNGKQSYSIVVMDNDRIAAKKTLSTTKSMTAYFKELKEMVAGKPMDFVFDVPAGEHSYTIKLIETAAKSVSLKLSIPKTDLDKSDNSGE
jgi:hypothetical protein